MHSQRPILDEILQRSGENADKNRETLLRVRYTNGERADYILNYLGLDGFCGTPARVSRPRETPDLSDNADAALIGRASGTTLVYLHFITAVDILAVDPETGRVSAAEPYLH